MILFSTALDSWWKRRGKGQQGHSWKQGFQFRKKKAFELQLQIAKRFGEKADIFEKVLEKFDIEDKLEIKEKVLRAYNSDDVSGITLFPEAEGLLKELKERKIKTAIVTSGLYSRQTKKIEILGLEKMVDFIIIHNIEKEGSKDESFKRTIRKLKAKPENIVSIGDRVFSEIKISNTLGMHTVQFLHGRYKKIKPKGDLEEPDFKIKNLSELTGIIKKIEFGKKPYPSIVLIGGGSGTSILLQGLKKYTPNLTAIVTVTDTGRTTGMIRKELGIMGTGDIRNCLTALSKENGLLKNLFDYRFEEGSWKGYAFGNIFLAALAKTTGSYKEALREASRILAIRGRVLPATLTDTHICVELEDGTIIEEEDNIVARDEDVSKRSPIKKAFLKPESASALPEAIESIKQADAIIIGPGCLYTSLIPNLLVKDLAKAVRESKARKIYICNIMTQQGQTDNYPASMHVKKIEECIGKDVLDYVIFNTEVPARRFLEAYEKENAFFVEVDKEQIKNMKLKPVYVKALQKDPQKKAGVNKRDYLRHDSKKIAKAILKLL